MADKSNLYKSINVPLPSKLPKFSEEDTLKTACDKIDCYFEDLIRHYPKSTQKRLGDMYYHNDDVWSFDLYSTGILAKAIFISSEGVVRYDVSIDSELDKCPITSRLIKIHEVAGHIGQYHQRVQQVGADSLLQECKEGNFDVFTEQSAAIPEYILYHLLPMRLLEEDLKNIENDEMRTNIKEEVKNIRSMKLEDRIHLDHRAGGEHLTERDHQRFMQLKPVKKCIAKFEKHNQGIDSAGRHFVESIGKLGTTLKEAGVSLGASLFHFPSTLRNATPDRDKDPGKPFTHR